MTYIIAEIGINHNGDLSLAKKLIEIAKDCGVDAVKFQKRSIDNVYTQEYLDSHRDSPWGTTQRDQKKGLEFTLQNYREIDAFCKEMVIDWFASSWDIDSQKQMREFNFKYNKIASAMATNHDFVAEVASENVHTFISTGMMDIEMIDKTVTIFREHNCEFTLLHTVSTYPSKEEDLNLLCLNTLREKYKCPVGYSGHEVSVSPSIMATVLGATVIERHLTLDRAMYGSDQSASLEPRGLKELVSQIKKVPICLGNPEKKIQKDEYPVAEKLRYWQTK